MIRLIIFYFSLFVSHVLTPSLTDESTDIPIMQHTLKEVDDLIQTKYVANKEQSDLQSVETLYAIVSCLNPLMKHRKLTSTG